MEGQPVSSLRNLGGASERMLAAAGIVSAEQLDRLGAVEAYRRVVSAGARPSLNLLWALEAALLDLDWRSLPDDHKAVLLEEYDARAGSSGAEPTVTRAARGTGAAGAAGRRRGRAAG